MAEQPQIPTANSRAVLKRTIALNSLQAHKVMNRSFDRLKRSLFSIGVILQIIADHDDVDRVEAFIAEHFKKVSEEMATAKQQLEKILEDNGIDERVTYSEPKKYEVEIDSPKTKQFIDLVKSLDELMCLIDTAWLNGEFESHQKKEASYQWQQRLIKLAAQIISNERRARIAAYNKGKQTEVDEAAPEVKPEIVDEELEEAVEKEVKAADVEKARKQAEEEVAVA